MIHTVFIYIFRKAQCQGWSVSRCNNDNGDAFCSDRNSGSCRCCNDRGSDTPRQSASDWRIKGKTARGKDGRHEKVLVPSENRSDVEEFDEEITGGMEIVFVSEMKQVLEHALVPGNQDK